MKVIVTCGPSYEPIDEVRRVTNFSTGRLGVTLANVLSAAGHEVVCFKGEQATFPGKVKGAVIAFSTTDDLAAKLRGMKNADVIFHAAALADFRVAEVIDSQKKKLSARKISTAHDEIFLRLVPTAKVLPKLRKWFPKARIVGWKYEADGSCDEAIDKAFAQIRKAKTDGCVVNGPAYGEGFGFSAPDGSHHALKDLRELTRFLRAWVEKGRK